MLVNEKQIAVAYDTGLKRLTERWDIDGSKDGTYAILPILLAESRGGPARFHSIPEYSQLSEGEQYAIGILYQVIEGIGDPINDYPQFIEPITILQCELGELESSPLVWLASGALSNGSLKQLNRFVDVVSQLITALSDQSLLAIERMMDKSLAVSRSAIVLHRSARSAGEDWSDARSWFGGAPRLGEKRWPRSRNGKPMAFFAQIDLAHMAKIADPIDLPTVGALAFFVGAQNECAVVHVAHTEASNFSPVPNAMPNLSNLGAEYDYQGDQQGRPLFPFWPVDMMAVELSRDMNEDEGYVAVRSAVERAFGQRKYNISAREVFGGSGTPHWWQHAHFYLEFLEEKLDKAQNAEEGLFESVNLTETRYRKVEAELAGSSGNAELIARQKIRDCQRRLDSLKETISGIESTRKSFVHAVEKMRSWVAGHDRWSVMNDAEWQELDQFIDRIPEFSLYTGRNGRSEIELQVQEVFEALPEEGSSAFEALPAHVRNVIRAKRAPRPQWWYTAIQLAETLQKTSKAVGGIGIVGSLLGKLTGNGSDRVAFQGLVRDTRSWVADRDPWSQMSTDDAAHMHAVMERIKHEFKTLVQFRMPLSLENFETRTLILLASGNHEAYATLPDAARSRINKDYCLPVGGGRHQMFGVPMSIQDNAVLDNSGRHLLLQLCFDDLMCWSFGDCGVYQFWISPEDLEQGNWSAVNVTFECG